MVYSIKSFSQVYKDFTTYISIIKSFSYILSYIVLYYLYLYLFKVQFNNVTSKTWTQTLENMEYIWD